VLSGPRPVGKQLTAVRSGPLEHERRADPGRPRAGSGAGGGHRLAQAGRGGVEGLAEVVWWVEGIAHTSLRDPGGKFAPPR
jgi:hypothetical protein